ncbi:solute carrier family 13 (sodium-dependent dicarboxylate transporter), member 2/3/5 [Sediminibacillus halophilus]|uniref:Sodium-dependent dicarboxylate transporter SdcS n=2 Tax=Sediminibacillus halophilus TaxID=482461 RepID=A0A1G9RG39_9BACI|nr:DASS family sodium-coupled anion symporter [Sediminibacillus halophilus]SDM22206.1 solute carrier family 13 (sodium-dependent dicarboxylate transporter), member 2/3/5 [Sediminibacillus halophilus]
MKALLNRSWQGLWLHHRQLRSLLQFFADGNGNRSSNGKPPKSKRFNNRQRIGMCIGPLLFLAILLFFHPSGLDPSGVSVLASTVWIAVWWITEAIPIPATSLLPIVLFPLTGGLDIDTTTSSYGSDTIFLFMGGFIIALAMEKWNLHKRIALSIILAIGTSTEKIILGFMIATGFLSMWISNTATAMMMVPIGLAIIYQVADSLNAEKPGTVNPDNFMFGKALMLGIAYSASIGGLGTIIGTPPNTIMVGFIKETYGIDISFALWMAFGVPLVIVLMTLAWYYLIKIAYPPVIKQLPGGKEVIQKEKQSLGTMQQEERIVSIVFALAAVAWITRSFLLNDLIPGINDAVIAISAAIILFTIPANKKHGGYIMDWETAKRLPWGILLLFGGGLAIAAGFTESGLARWMGEQLTVLGNVHLFVIVLLTVAMVIFLTEITSNTATGTMMMPIMASLAMAIDVHPYTLMAAAAIAASCAFMLPVATPPNAVVFGSGYLKIPDMAKAGIFLNIAAIAVITLAVFYLLRVVWGIDIQSFPPAMK